MSQFLMQTYTIVLPIALGYIVWLLQQQRKERMKDAIERDRRIQEENRRREANCEGTKCLLRVKLIEYHDKYVDQGNIPSYALKNWIDMYNAYKGLGGNGMIEGMDKEVRALTIL